MRLALSTNLLFRKTVGRLEPLKQPEFRAKVRVEKAWAGAAFIRHIGAELVDVASGLTQSRMLVSPNNLQQDGVCHAGAMGTLLDHTAGCAGFTVLQHDWQYLLTLDYRVQLLRPAPAGSYIHCFARVISRTKKVIHAEATAYAVDLEDFDPERPQSLEQALEAQERRRGRRSRSKNVAITPADFVASTATVSLMVLEDEALRRVAEQTGAAGIIMRAQ